MRVRGSVRDGSGLNTLAELYRKTGRYKEAEPLYQRALKIAEAQRAKKIGRSGKNLMSGHVHEHVHIHEHECLPGSALQAQNRSLNGSESRRRTLSPLSSSPPAALVRTIPHARARACPLAL